MPEEPIRSQDIDPAGTAGAAFLGTKQMQKLERALEEAHRAAARIMRHKNDRIALLEEERTELRARNQVLESKVRTLYDLALNEEQPGPIEKWL